MNRLHIGAGNVILPGFVNLDAREAPGIDLVAPAYPLDGILDETFDLVYASHVLEHFHRGVIDDVLREWVRVLKHDGALRLAVPSFEHLVEIYVAHHDLSQIIGPLFGRQDYAQNFHFVTFDEATLRATMERAGLEAVHPWDFRRTTHSAHWDNSQATTLDIPISLNLEGRKK